MNSDSDSELPLHESPKPTASNRTRQLQTIPRSIRRFLRFISQIGTTKFLWLAATFYAAMTLSGSAPKMDFFTLQETKKGKVILITLIIWCALFIKHFQVTLWDKSSVGIQLRRIRFLICAAIVIFLACLLFQYIKSLSDEEASELYPRIASSIPVAFTLLLEVVDNTMILTIKAWDKALGFGFGMLADGTRRLGYGLENATV